MRSKNNFVILLALLAIIGGGFYAFTGSDEPKDIKHAQGDADEHSHDEAEADHAEGGDHEHGDADEHSHGEGDEHDHNAGEDSHGGHEEVKISDAAIQKLNIEVEEVSSALVQETIAVTGRITLNQNTSAQVKARFSGVIRSVLKEPGETVKAGGTLATVESNDSLQIYAVKSPVAGVVVSRNASVGEVAADLPLFVVADVTKLWAELFVFSKDGDKLQAGQKVRIQCLDDPITSEATVSVVLPTAETSSQTVIARAVVDNPDNHWRPGMNIRADIVMQEKEVPLAVKTEAIQRMEGNNVVFVQEDGGIYRAQPVQIGTSDATWTEIIGGLEAGQRYVAKNSFVVKADIGKSGAEHEH